MSFLKNIFYWAIGLTLFFGLFALFPIAMPIGIGCLAFWALMTFGKRINKENGC